MDLHKPISEFPTVLQFKINIFQLKNGIYIWAISKYHFFILKNIDFKPSKIGKPLKLSTYQQTPRTEPQSRERMWTW